jgi:thiamine-monophosphate kinase
MTSPPPKLDGLDEFGLIARYLAPLAVHPAARGLTDDVAVLAGQGLGSGLVLNADAIVSGVHFLPDESPALIAERALRVNLSDLAAKGAEPIGYLLTLALGPECDEAWLADFAGGLATNQATFGWSLLGGDTVRTPGPSTISVTALGRASAAGVPMRGGAGVGDFIWVTGTIGDGALGLASAQERAPDINPALLAEAERKFRMPEPRVRFGQAAVAAGLITASADVSDGLVADIGHIASASGIGATIQARLVPLSDAGKAAVEADRAWLSTMLSGGDDYEIIFTAAATDADALLAFADEFYTPLTCIGVIDQAMGMRVLNAEGEALDLSMSGYKHL